MMQQRAAAVTFERPQIGKWLFCCGSVSQVMGKQVVTLVRHTQWLHLELEPSQLVTNACQAVQPTLENLMQTVPEEEGVILSIVRKPTTTGVKLRPDLVIAGMAEVAVSLLRSHTWQGLFLSGGDTAEAVLTATGATAIILYEEVLPGLVRGEIIGGTCDTLPVVTKAGAFGTGNTLINLINILK